MNVEMKKFPRSVVYLHWISAIALVVAFFTGNQLEDVEDAEERIGVLQIHVFSSMLVLAIGVWRLYIYNRAKKHAIFPEPLDSGHPIKNFMKNLVQGVLRYIILLVGLTGLWALFNSGQIIPVFSGDFHDFSVSEEVPAVEIHHIMSKVWIPLVGLHLAGLMLFIYRRKVNILRRMRVFK